MEKKDFHTLKIEEVAQVLQTNIEEGLSQKEAEKRLWQFGPNEIEEEKPVSPIFLFLKQFKSWLIYILIFAIFLCLFAKKFFDALLIFLVILIAAALGFLQEYRAEKTLKALKKFLLPYAKVIRDGEFLKIKAKELVPGDILLLEPGDMILADGRIVEAKNFKVIESALTGESLPVEKGIKPLSQETPLPEQSNMAWLGTLVASGEARIIVTATGKDTILGSIAKGLKEIKRPKTHFKERADFLVKQMGIFAIFTSILAFLIVFFFQKTDLLSTIYFAISVLVSSVPEGLPAALTITLAVGARRMAKQNAIVRNLPTIETLNVVNLIITDKTGTLTLNTLDVEKIYLKNEIRVTGSGWVPQGDFLKNDKKISPNEDPILKKFLEICAICPSARLIKKENTYQIFGDPTEGAMVVLAEKGGIKKEALSEEVKKLDEIPFSSELRYRASLISFKKEPKRKEIFVIGAPEKILELSSLDFEGEEFDKKELFLKKTKEWAKEGLRVLAVAFRPVSYQVEKLTPKLIHDLIFLGLMGMEDPIRPEVKEAIFKAKEAKVKVIMATGDHKETALAIAKKIGLIGKGESFALTEIDLEGLKEKDLEEALKKTSVLARISPKGKLKILETFQKMGYIVAMTGDGINDALALKKADIGIAMGKIGSEVAKEASDLVLLDDNFATIIKAVGEGRTVFSNIRRVSAFLVTTNLAEVITLISSLILGKFIWHENLLILLPTAILFLNLVTDGCAVIPLALEPYHPHILKMPPRKKGENFLNLPILGFMLIMMLCMVPLTLFFFHYFYPPIEKARSAAFLTMAMTQVFNVFNMRSLRQSIFKIGFFSNKYVILGMIASYFFALFSLFFQPLSQNFGFGKLSFKEILLITSLSSIVLLFGEIYKWIRRKIKK